MVEDWLLSIVKAIGFFFIHPMFYIGLLLTVFVSYRRILRERRNLGLKVFDPFIEMKSTVGFGLLNGLLVSLLFVGLGIGLSFETILVLNASFILFMLRGRFTLLSVAYTFGLAYLVIYFSPLIIRYFDIAYDFTPSTVELTALVVMAGLFLMIEAVFIQKSLGEETMPELELGPRGRWIGFQRLSKIGVIPFFMIVPGGLITPFASFWPILPLGDASYGLLLFPLFLGFDYKLYTEKREEQRKVLARPTLILGILVLLLAISSYYVTILSLVGISLAIIGKEWIHYRHRLYEQGELPYFTNRSTGVIVLAVLPNTPAERIGIQVGEIVKRINGVHVTTETALYHALQKSGSFCKIEVIDIEGEQRFLQSPLYEGDHHRLGIITVDEPFRHKGHRSEELSS